VANEEVAVEAIAQAWNMTPEQLRCHGCKSRVNAVYCVDCDIKRCAENKQVEYCFECDEYPCSRLVDFKNDEHPHHSIVLQNLNFIQEQGVDEWLRVQKTRWSCANCGTSFTWYAQVCKMCGGELYSCRDEEKDVIDD
jgi:rRNA maturation endonuclease Nob1